MKRFLKQQAVNLAVLLLLAAAILVAATINGQVEIHIDGLNKLSSQVQQPAK